MNEKHSTPPPPPPERRRFLKWVTHGLSALFGAVLGFPAIAYLIDPRNRAARAGDFKPVARLDELEKNKPTQVVIRDVRSDAWTLHPNDVVGRVWLIRRSDTEVDAFTTICPHLGCSINFDVNQQLFVCPCHNGTFDLSGTKQEKASGGGTNPAPRDMDRLELRVIDGVIEVKYENFYQGEHEKKPKK